MAGCAFFLSNLLEDLLIEHSEEASSTPAENIENGRQPQVPFGHGTTDTTTSFYVDGDNDKLDFDEGAGEVTATLTHGHYTGQGLADHIDTVMNAAASTLAFDVQYNDATNKFDFSETSGPTNFSLLWDTGTNAASSVGSTIGFDTSADDTGANGYVADNVRYAGHTWVKFDAGSGSTIDADVWWLQRYGDSSTVFGTVKLYGHTSDLGDTRADWDGTADVTVSFSTRGTDASINPAEIAITKHSDAKRWWFVSWEHEDTSPKHHVGILQAFAETTSSDFNVQELADHGLTENTPAYDLDTEYVVEGYQAWRVALSFDAWKTADYRSVVLAMVKLGKHQPFGWALNWDQLSANPATATGADEADHGWLVWVSRVSPHSGSFSGAGSDYVSDTVELLQRS